MSRSKWKGPYFKSFDLKNKKKIQEIKRNFEITPEFVGKSIKIHTGKKFIKVLLTENMVSHKVGEFSPTKSKFEFKKKKKKK